MVLGHAFIWLLFYLYTPQRLLAAYLVLFLAVKIWCVLFAGYATRCADSLSSYAAKCAELDRDPHFYQSEMDFPVCFELDADYLNLGWLHLIASDKVDWT